MGIRRVNARPLPSIEAITASSNGLYGLYVYWERPTDVLRPVVDEFEELIHDYDFLDRADDAEIYIDRHFDFIEVTSQLFERLTAIEDRRRDRDQLIGYFFTIDFLSLFMLIKKVIFLLKELVQVTERRIDFVSDPHSLLDPIAPEWAQPDITEREEAVELLSDFLSLIRQLIKDLNLASYELRRWEGFVRRERFNELKNLVREYASLTEEDRLILRNSHIEQIGQLNQEYFAIQEELVHQADLADAHEEAEGEARDESPYTIALEARMREIEQRIELLRRRMEVLEHFVHYSDPDDVLRSIIHKHSVRKTLTEGEKPEPWDFVVQVYFGCDTTEEEYYVMDNADVFQHHLNHELGSELGGLSRIYIFGRLQQYPRTIARFIGFLPVGMVSLGSGDQNSDIAIAQVRALRGWLLAHQPIGELSYIMPRLYMRRVDVAEDEDEVDWQEEIGVEEGTILFNKFMITVFIRQDTEGVQDEYYFTFDQLGEFERLIERLVAGRPIARRLPNF